MRHIGLILVAALALARPVQAGLFADDEAQTRQIQALQQRVDALDARLGKIEAHLQKNQQLLELLQEVETLKAEIAKLRGQAEIQAHQVDTLGKRQTDLYADLDQRVTDLAKAAKPAPEGAQSADAQPAAAVGDAPQLDPLVETRGYEAALAHFRAADYPAAIAGFKGFLKAYPQSELAVNAQYWIGYSYYALKDYKTALAHQQKLVATYPASPKVPDALLNIAACQIALDNLKGARKTLEEIVAKHPGTNAATLAAKRLAALK